ncbi:hypothetical protein [Facilibium subflavum]|uniref:hypothetical protein n=1 Tax=Facilibium subflavum TaxID=2219058 RepID=UPI000E6483B3|nr:hypothetical protein [Facilibium subflavum]
MEQQEMDARLKLILTAQIDKLDELEKVWMYGYAHGKADKPDTDNPFPQNTVEYNYWLEGFESGEYGEEPLFPEYISILAETSNENDETIQKRKRFHLDKIDKLIAGTGIGVATASMVAAALINFVA